MVRRDVLATGCRRGMIAFGVLAGLLSVNLAQAQAAPAPQAQPVSNQRLFPNDGGMVLNFIKPDKVADFEMVIGKLKEALAKSDKPGRKQQAAGWKIFKAAEPGPNGSVIYVSTVDPVVKGADYTVSTILAEAFPTEVQALYKSYSEAYVSQNLINLTLVTDLK